MTHLFSLRFLLALAATVGIAIAANPLKVSWSDKTYGPDGPWNAVKVSIGSKWREIDLYPGGRWGTKIFLDSVCSNKSSTCWARSAGVFNLNASTSATLITTRPRVDSDTNYTGINNWNGTAYLKGQYIADKIWNYGVGTVNDASIYAINDAYQTYPNGKKYPVSVGILSLGGPKKNHVVDGWVLNMLAPYTHFDQKDNYQTPSDSFGMHIGSAAQGIPGSLILGGYDKSRVLGDVNTQALSSEDENGKMQIALSDLSVGVASGGSPWSYQNKSGLLRGLDVDNQNVEVDPTVPYLYLPRETCDAIANELPVTFNKGLGLYLWERSKDGQDDISSSPAYLGVTFWRDGQNNRNMTIKVPFKLLKLTLERPLVHHNTSYFPCYPSESGFKLGRAFLQAAFVGVNWKKANSDGVWFLAQAPGPSRGPSSSLEIAEGDDTIQGSDSSWEASWASSWEPIASSDSASSLSTGAKAGVGVGCGIAGILLIGLAWFLFTRCRRSKATSDKVVDDQPAMYSGYQHQQLLPSEIGSAQINEAGPGKEPGLYEAPQSPVVRHELG